MYDNIQVSLNFSNGIGVVTSVFYVKIIRIFSFRFNYLLSLKMSSNRPLCMLCSPHLILFEDLFEDNTCFEGVFRAFHLLSFESEYTMCRVSKGYLLHPERPSFARPQQEPVGSLTHKQLNYRMLPKSSKIGLDRQICTFVPFEDGFMVALLNCLVNI